MKKAISIIITICTTLSLTSCSESKTEHPDYISGNPSDIWGNAIMETEDGFYRNLDHFRLMLCYYDKATGKAVYLCAKPECTHDGNEYCTATKEGVFYDANICKSGEYVYYSASEYVEADEKEYYKLMRVKADGTEFTELCTYQTTVGHRAFHGISAMNFGRVMAVHRGYAIVPYYDYDLPTLTEDYTPNTMIIDIESGSYKKLPSPDIDLTKTQYGQGDYFLYEDWLYYTISMENTNNFKSLYRYNLVSGVTEKVDISVRFTSYAVIDGCVYYSTPTKAADTMSAQLRQEGGTDAAQPSATWSKLWKYDPETGSTTDLSEQLLIDGQPFTNAVLMWNGEYLIIQDTHNWTGSEGIAAANKDKVLFMDKDGNAVADYDFWDAPVPRHIDEFKDKEYIEYGLKSQNGKLYICTHFALDDPRIDYTDRFNDLVLCCEIEDIISGNAEWYEPFDFYQLLKPEEDNNAGA